MRERRDINWSMKIDSWGRSLLESLGYDPDYLPTDHNPIVRAIQSDPHFVADREYDPAFNRISLSKLATLCQMVVYDARGGPDGDQENKALRRHWYHWYKVDFAQPLSVQFGEDPQDSRWGLNWAGRLSVTYAYFVDEEDVMYFDLWVKDASRMMKVGLEELVKRFNLLLAVEKDSLFEDFIPAAQALGAFAVISGKGKNSKAAIEKLLREAGKLPRQEWDYDRQDYVMFRSVDYKNPLYILHISDHDFDGEAVIGPTFGEQARRYFPGMVREGRAGIIPAQVPAQGENLSDKMYEVKISHQGAVDWAEEKALFIHTCMDCGQRSIRQGANGNRPCSECGGVTLAVVVKKRGGDTPYGLEVEALPTRAYYGFLVDALLRLIPFEEIVLKLRHEATADAWDAANQILNRVRRENEDYQRLLAEFQRLEEIKEEFEQAVMDEIRTAGEPHVGDFWQEGDDPEPDDFVQYVRQARGTFVGPWRPFDRYARTQLLVEYLEREEAGRIRDLIDQDIEF